MTYQKFRSILPGALLFFLGACTSVVAPLAKPSVSQETAALRAGEYNLDQKHAALMFEIDHLGYSTYLGRFNIFDARLDFDEASPEAARVDAIIDMKSLDIANPDFAQTLTGPQWFDADQFPQAVFRSTSITVTGEATGEMLGELTLHGVTRPVRLEVTFNGGGRDLIRNAYIVGFSASGQIKRSEFGVDRLGGLLANTVRIRIEAEFKKN